MAEGQEGWLGKLTNLIKPRPKTGTTTPTPAVPAETPVSKTPTAEAPMSPTAGPTDAPPSPTKA